MLILSLILLVPLCWARQDEGRIVGGTDASEGQFPYQVSFRSNNKHFCGGSIISKKVILTSARCVYGRNVTLLVAVVGTNHLNSGGSSYSLSKACVHEGYHPYSINNDIALAFLTKEIQFNQAVQPISLACQNPIPGTSVVLSGWGRNKKYPNTGLPNNLQQITLKTISNQQCQNGLPYDQIFDTQICTKSRKNHGPCGIDNGEPLVISNSVQVGIVCWGIPCALGYPDVYTSVASYRSWIKANAGV